MTGRILIVDGLATNRITLKVRLSAACYEVLTAQTYHQVVNLTVQQQPDLIIVGTSFSGAAPVTLCRQLSQNPDLAQVPILVQCPSEKVIDVLRAGATATLDPHVGENMLLARIRSLLRGQHNRIAVCGQTEAPESSDITPQGDITLIADTAGRAMGWRQLLSQHLDCRFTIQDAEQALASANRDEAADLYLIAADLESPGEGLRLLAELRSRTASRNSAFVVAVPQNRPDLATIALDLGAGDTMQLTLRPDHNLAEATAMMISAQLRYKGLADRRRAEAERHRLWAMTDPLTGLYNRRYALPRLTKIAKETKQRRQPFSLLAIDVDRFKQINDRYGHSAGDAALVEIAQRIAQTVANLGITARIGGEEFLAILPGIEIDQASAIAEHIRRTVMNRPINMPSHIGGGEISATISIGVAQSVCPGTTPDPALLAENTLARADRAMFEAKSLGRNRVIQATTVQAA